MSPWWTLAATTNVSTGTTSFAWIDAGVTAVSHLRFYRAGDGETDSDNDGFTDARELLLYTTSPEDDASFPVTLSGEVIHTNTPQTGPIVIVAVTASNSWDTGRSDEIATPGAFAVEGVPNLADTWLKAWRDWHPNGLLDPWESTGALTNNPLYLTTAVSNLVIELEDPPASISGTVSYSGRQTGPIRVVAVTASNDWDLAHGVTLSEPGFFHISGLEQTSYWVKAWIDADSDEAFDSDREAWGVWPANPISLSNSVWGVDFALTDVDADDDDLPDWWEYEHFGSITNQNDTGDFDGDNMPNAWEYVWAFDPADPLDAMDDADADGYPNVYECVHDTDPRKATSAPDEGGLDPTPAPTITVTTNGAQTIQQALDAATNAYDIVLVKAGFYSVTNDIDFHAGRTVLLLGESGAQATVLDGGDASRLVDFPSNVLAHTALIGFALQNGRADEGGAICCEGASPLIAGCIVTACHATDDGGGLFVSGGSPRVENCTFAGNTADDDGGGVRCKAQSSPAFVDCVVSNNAAKHGGGMHWTSSTGTVVNCVLSDNEADKDGGGIYGRETDTVFDACLITRNLAQDDGGGIRCTNASPSFVACVISTNTAHDHGGGFYGNDSGALLDGCLISGNTAVDGGGVGCNGSTIELNRCALLDNWAHADGGGLRAKDSQPRVRNSLFARNRAYGEGGGVHIKGPTAVLALENCTVTDNRGRLAGGGMVASDGATASATNSIFWGNAPDQLDGVSNLTYSCVEGGSTGTAILTNHPGLTAVYYRLLPESPCIDAGTNAAWMTEAMDLHGQSRIGDDTVDIGAEEWYGAVSGGDAPGDGTPGGVWPLSSPADSELLRLEFSVGDPSNSGSETYRIVFSNDSEVVVRECTAFGVVHTFEHDFLKGTAYTVRVEHIATTGTSACGANPDYDYRAWIAERPDSTNGTHDAWFGGPGFVVHDPDRILGTHWTDGCTSTFVASNKIATLYVLKVDFGRLWDSHQEANRTTRAIDPTLRVTMTYEDNARADHDLSHNSPMLVLGGWCTNLTAADVNLKCQFEPASAGQHVLWKVDASVGSVDGDSTGNFACGDTVPLRLLPSTATMANHTGKDFVVKLGIDQDGNSVLSDTEAFPLEWGIRVIGKPEYDHCRSGLPAWQITLGWLLYPDTMDFIDIFLDTDSVASYQADDPDTVAFSASYDMKNGLGCDPTSLTQGNLRRYTWQNPAGLRKRILLSDDIWAEAVQPTIVAMDIGGWYADPVNAGSNYKAFAGIFSNVVSFSDENLGNALGAASVNLMVTVLTERATPKPNITHMQVTGTVTDLYDFRTHTSDEANGYASRIQVCYAPSCGRTAGNIFNVLVDCAVTQFTLSAPTEHDDFTDLISEWTYWIVSGW